MHMQNAEPARSPLDLPIESAGSPSAEPAAGTSPEGLAPPDALEAEGTDRADPKTFPDRRCLAKTVCALKDRMRWRKPAWSAETCDTIAKAVLSSAKRHRLHPALLLAVMINESSLDENGLLISNKDGREARDSGLMGIRCVVDEKQRCTNVPVRGRTWKSVMDPVTNIEIGAAQLARWRDGGAIERVVTRVRDRQGRVQEIRKTVPCRHKNHAYWAHYNHGPVYITKGYARHYPHRVAVLYHSIARTFALDAPELRQMPITMNDPGKRPRTVDRPMEARYRELCSLIDANRGRCGDVLSLSSTAPASSRAH